MLLFPSPPKPCRKNCQKQCANTGSGKSAYTLPFKADSAGEERQATYQERDRMEHLQFSIHFQIAFFILSFHRDFYTWYIRQNSCYDFIRRRTTSYLPGKRQNGTFAIFHSFSDCVFYIKFSSRLLYVIHSSKFLLWFYSYCPQNSEY